MKKLLSIAIILLFVCFTSDAQLVQQGFNGTGSYEIDNTNETKVYSQSMKVFRTLGRIILDKKEDGRSCFYKFVINTPDYNHTSSVEFPSNYDVKDFDILGDSIYFCGVIEEAGRKDAFIGYTSVSQLFNDTDIPANPSQNLMPDYTFTKILPPSVDSDTIMDIRKVRAYYDATGSTMLAAIGSMYYGSGAYTATEPTFNISYIATDSIDGKKYYYDYLLKYRITESVPFWQIDTVLVSNIVSMYRNPRHNGPINNSDSNHMYNIADYSYAEYFEDMTLTDDYICIVSSTYQDSLNRCFSHIKTDGHDNKLIIRCLNKNTGTHTSALITPPDTIPYHPMYGIKLEHMDKNTVAVGYTKCNYPTSDDTRLYISVVSCSDTVISMANTLYIKDNGFVKGDMLKDIKYNGRTKELFVLKNKFYINDFYSDLAIYRIDPFQWYPHPITLIDLTKSFVPAEEIHNYNIWPVWNNLLFIQEKDIPIMNICAVGKQNGNIAMFETNLYNNKQQCYEEESVDIIPYKIAMSFF